MCGRLEGYGAMRLQLEKAEGWEGQKESHENKLFVLPFFLFEMGGWEGMGLCNCNCKRLRDTKRNEHEMSVLPFFLFEIGRKTKDTGGEQEPRGRG